MEGALKEYTLIASVGVVLAILADTLGGTRLLKRPRFYGFLSIILFFKLGVNGFLTAAPVVMYNPDFFIGARVGSIPVEDFLFGFSMVLLVVMVWEKMKTEDKMSKGEAARR
jgi:lycopene cyclase domain-containing protein